MTHTLCPVCDTEIAEDTDLYHECGKTVDKLKTVGGMLSKYKNVELWEHESRAWELAVQGKYADRKQVALASLRVESHV